MFFSCKSKKFSKYHYLVYNSSNSVYKTVDPDSYCIQILQNCYLDESVLTSLIKFLKKKFPKKTVIRLCKFPDYYIYAKPQEVRMGKGKGNPDSQISYIKKGQILFLIQITKGSIDKVLIDSYFKECLQKLPVCARILTKIVW
jgi:large subunit ribosomal protein L16